MAVALISDVAVLCAVYHAADSYWLQRHTAIPWYWTLQLRSFAAYASKCYIPQ